MKIKRIDSYTDCRFSQVALRQHGCFLVDDVPCEIEIISNKSAIIRGVNSNVFSAVIDEFRFYAPNISQFYDRDGNVVKEFEPKNVFEISLTKIQPSQFYVDNDKVSAIGTFIQKPEDIIIQVVPYGERYISLDGHTRLYYAVMMGWHTVYAVEEKSDDWAYKFVDEAVRRKIFTPMDMKRVAHEEYEKKWNNFCDELFAESDGE